MQNPKLIIKMALDSIFHNKLRAFLTILGIVIGVSSVISIMSIGAGAQSLITSSIQNIGTNLVAILPGKSDDSGPPASALGIVITTLKADDARAIEQLPNVDAVTAYSRGNGDLVYQNRSIAGNFTGVSSSFVEVEDHDLEIGRFFNQREQRGATRVAVLGADIRDELFPFANPLGANVKINNVSFRVIGVLERKGSFLVNNPDNQIYIPLEAAQNILLGYDHLGFIRLKVDNEENVDSVKDNIRKLLRFRHSITDPANDDFSVRSLSQALDVFTGITSGLKFFLAAIAAISLIVGGIGITNIMLMTIKERTREIGLRKAIGAKPENIKNQFLIEALVLTVIGGVGGIVVGISLSFVLAIVVQQLGYEWQFVVPPTGIIASVAVSIIIGLTFGVYPAKKAAKLNPIESLRYE